MPRYLFPYRGGAGSGPTIPHTLNLLAGDNAGGVADAGLLPAAANQLPKWTYVAGGGSPGSGQFTADTSNPNTTATLKFHNNAKGGIDFSDYINSAKFNTTLIIAGVASGKLNAFYPLSNPVAGAFATMAVSLQGASESAWSGDYSLGIFPSLSGVVALSGVTTGNIPVFANNTGDVQDSAIPAASLATQTYADTVSAAAGSTAQTNAEAYTDTQISALPPIPTPDTGWTANADAGDKTAVIPAQATIATVAAALDVLVPGAGAIFTSVASKTKALEAAGANNKLPSA